MKFSKRLGLKTVFVRTCFGFRQDKDSGLVFCFRIVGYLMRQSYSLQRKVADCFAKSTVAIVQNYFFIDDESFSEQLKTNYLVDVRILS